MAVVLQNIDRSWRHGHQRSLTNLTRLSLYTDDCSKYARILTPTVVLHGEP